MEAKSSRVLWWQRSTLLSDARPSQAPRKTRFHCSGSDRGPWIQARERPKTWSSANPNRETNCTLTICTTCGCSAEISALAYELLSSPSTSEMAPDGSIRIEQLWIRPHSLHVGEKDKTKFLNFPDEVYRAVCNVVALENEALFTAEAILMLSVSGPNINLILLPIAKQPSKPKCVKRPASASSTT
jgi:hypothetical protein